MTTVTIEMENSQIAECIDLEDLAEHIDYERLADLVASVMKETKHDDS